jgi:hypothetical protein
MTLRIFLVSVAVIAASCTKVSNVFECENNAQCRIDGQDGRCERSGFCSLADDGCSSGWRYDRSADPSLAGQCLVTEHCTAPYTAEVGAVTSTCIEIGAPVIDGDLADWDDALFSTVISFATADAAGGSWTGNPEMDDADLLARVAWRWDLTYFYVAAKLTDDRLEVNPSAPTWENDAFELFLDGEGDRSGPYGPNDHQVLIRFDGVAEARRELIAVPLPLGLLVATSLEGGPGTDWVVELAMPFAALGDNSPAPGRLLGVDIVLEDRDDPDLPAASQSMTWRKLPSGGGCSIPSCSTAHFAALQLGGL